MDARVDQLEPDGREPVQLYYDSLPLLIWYIYLKDMALYSNGGTPWHWHPDIEVFWVIQGGLEVDTNEQHFTLEEGEGLFINTGILHRFQGRPGPEPLVLIMAFDSQFVAGFYQSVFEKKYITPVLECRSLEAMKLSPTVADHRKIFELMEHACEVREHAEEGYEFEMRNTLSSIWFLIYTLAKPYLAKPVSVPDPETDRIKEMMLYVQQHYMEPIALTDIADAAHISERECLRCFNRFLNVTPFTYLSEYRIQRAAQMLCETQDSITDIAYACGFSGTSYFGKMFKKYRDVTPSQYRAQHQKEEKTVKDL